ncbi:MAG: ribonuclease HII [Turicibacter sp.]|nr:ribonuclease HII [Turicibacter sp.]
MLEYEEKLYNRGIRRVAGIDEVGRGTLAGPVTAAAVVLPQGLIIPDVDDSKKLSAKKRLELAEIIKEKALFYAIGWVSAPIIDKINILQATYLAMQRALENLTEKPEFLLIDGVKGSWQHEIDSIFIKKGDQKSQSIAAASILAKVARDDFMVKLHEKYPLYDFANNKGYGTPKHIAALKEHSFCPLHRETFLKFLEVSAE